MSNQVDNVDPVIGWRVLVWEPKKSWDQPEKMHVDQEFPASEAMPLEATKEAARQRACYVKLTKGRGCRVKFDPMRKTDQRGA